MDGLEEARGFGRDLRLGFDWRSPLVGSGGGEGNHSVQPRGLLSAGGGVALSGTVPGLRPQSGVPGLSCRRSVALPRLLSVGADAGRRAGLALAEPLRELVLESGGHVLRHFEQRHLRLLAPRSAGLGDRLLGCR